MVGKPVYLPMKQNALANVARVLFEISAFDVITDKVAYLNARPVARQKKMRQKIHA
jgi:hypothetical protein